MKKSTREAIWLGAVLAVLILISPFSLGAQVTGSTNLTVTGSGWTLAWSDEFNGTSLDATKWESRSNNPTQQNSNPPPGAVSYMTARTANISEPGDGYLHLIALHDNYVDPSGVTHPYTTGTVDSYMLEACAPNCAVEIRAKFPDGDGVWPSLWMMPVNDTYGGWPGSGEIDMFEMPASDPQEYASVHYGNGSNPQTAMTQVSAPAGTTFSSQFHVFRMEWLSGEIDFYVDGNPVVSYTCANTNWYAGNGAGCPSPYDKPFYMILSNGLGDCSSGWGICPDASTPFPSEMLIDYVRVYTKP